MVPCTLCSRFVAIFGMCLYMCIAARRDLNEKANQKRLDSLNNTLTITIFLVFVTNIFITVFGMERTGLFARMHFWLCNVGNGSSMYTCLESKNRFWPT